MTNYSNILIPVDFSKASEIAIRKTLENEFSPTAQITVVHVVDYMPPAYMRPEMPQIYASEDLMKQRAKKHLDEFIAKTGLIGCNAIVEFGHTKSQLLKMLSDKSFDLVILAKHERVGMEKLLGSVSNAIANEAKCDVLIVHD